MPSGPAGADTEDEELPPDGIAAAFHGVGRPSRAKEAAGLFDGLGSSAVLTLYARTVRAERLAQRKLAESSQPFHNLANTWDDEHGLRAGEQIDLSSMMSRAERRESEKARKVHPSQPRS